jgi:hypothetical protein
MQSLRISKRMKKMILKTTTRMKKTMEMKSKMMGMRTSCSETNYRLLKANSKTLLK